MTITIKKLDEKAKAERYANFVQSHLNGNFVERDIFKKCHIIYVLGWMALLLISGAFYAYFGFVMKTKFGDSQINFIIFLFGLAMVLISVKIIWKKLFTLAFKSTLPKEAINYYNSTINSRRFQSPY